MKLFQKRSLIIVGFIIPLLLNACGGGGGDNNNEDNRAPTVTSTSPLDGAIDVPRNNTLRATFDEDVFGVTVDETSFTLEKAGGSNTNGNVSFDGNRNVASFSPNRPLAVHAPYTATLSTAITDLSGNSLSSDYKWSFTTADGAWGEAQSIDTVDSDSVDRPQIAFDQSGNALAVWSEFDGTRRNIWSNRFNGTSWEVAEKIEIEDLGSAGSPQIAFDQSGNALAVWLQSDGTRSNIWSNRFDGTNWGDAEKIETGDLGTVFNPQISIDHSGNALAVWSQSDGTRSNIWSNRFNGTSWGVAEKIETEDFGSAGSPQIAFDQSGNALAVWLQSDGTRENIWSNRFNGTSWGVAEKIETDDLGAAFFPQIAIDQTDNALAVWSQSDGIRSNIWSNRFNGTSWGVAEKIETEDFGSASSPQIAIDQSGNALAVWRQFDGTRRNIWSNRFNGTSWEVAEKIEIEDLGSAGSPQIAFDQSGNALAVWSQSDGTRSNIWSNRFDGTNWGDAEKIENDQVNDKLGQQIAFDQNGNALAVWVQADGFIGIETTLMFNQFK